MSTPDDLIGRDEEGRPLGFMPPTEVIYDVIGSEGTIHVPKVSVRRGGIVYPQPGTPEWEERRTRQRIHDRLRSDWQTRQPTTETLGHVWVASIEHGTYDGGEQVLGLFTTEADAKNHCRWKAEEPTYSDTAPRVREIEWEGEGDHFYGWAGSYQFVVYRQDIWQTGTAEAVSEEVNT